MNALGILLRFWCTEVALGPLGCSLFSFQSFQVQFCGVHSHSWPAAWWAFCKVRWPVLARCGIHGVLQRYVLHDCRHAFVTDVCLHGWRSNILTLDWLVRILSYMICGQLLVLGFVCLPKVQQHAPLIGSLVCGDWSVLLP